MIRDLNPELIHLMFQLAAITSPNLHEINFMLANLLTSLEDYDKSIEVYKEIPTKHYLGEYASIQISNLYSLEDNNKEAIEQLEKFLKINKTFDGFLSLGNYYRYDSEWKEAAKAYQKAIDLGSDIDNQNLWEAYFKFGIVNERSDNWNEAENNFLKALELYSDQPDVLNYLGYSYIDMDTNMGVAKGMIEKALQQKPNDPYIIDSMAWYYFKTGAYEEAKSLLEYAIDLMPYDPIINEHYGDALWKSGKNVEARFHWSKALELDPEEETIADIKIKILKGI
jgi:tetratricopeptide (TPR) repeat protein